MVERAKESETHSYIPISTNKVRSAFKGKGDKELGALGITPGLNLMLKQGYATQLRDDIYHKISENFNVDISAEDNDIPDRT